MENVFLDRDGTIIEDVPYNFLPKNIRFMPKSIEGLQKLQKLGYKFIIVSNQAGIARGYYTEKQANTFNLILLQQLKANGIEIKKVYICPHHPDFDRICECRKPGPGMVLLSIKEFDVNAANSIYIGDKD